jgi:hypothetical protein
MEILNKRTLKGEEGVYVGRPSAWGNPFAIGRDGDRLEVIAKFCEYAADRLKREPGWLKPLVGQSLICWCAPQACHAEVLMILANGERDGMSKITTGTYNRIAGVRKIVVTGVR